VKLVLEDEQVEELLGEVVVMVGELVDGLEPAR